MIDIKVNLIMVLPGRIMLSEQECLRKVRKPLMGKGKNSDKKIIDRKGREVWVTVKEPDPEKCQRTVIEFPERNGDCITVYTRGARSATKSLNISTQAYRHFIGREYPEGFKPPKGFKPNFKLKRPATEQAWLGMNETERLEWHLRNICASMGGTLLSYNVFED